MHDLSPDEPLRDLNKSFLAANSYNECNSKMEYVWMEPRHDPIITDTNLAEIDFEDFRNEDLVYAFSCGEEESGGSSTDMSICRSEVLFSSTNQPNYLQTLVEGQSDSCLIQDSLIDAEFNYSEQLKVNKNHYTLTYSRHDGSMVVSAAPRGAVGHTGADAAVTTKSETSAPSKFTTWSNVGKRSVESNGSGGNLVTKYILNEENNNPESTTTNNEQSSEQKPSINNALSSTSSSSSSSKLIDRFFVRNSNSGSKIENNNADGRLNSIEETSPSSCCSSSGRRNLPDLGFLENDVNLWDAFFHRGKNSSKFPSVLRSGAEEEESPSTPHYQDYLRRRRILKKPAIVDAPSLRMLLPPSAQKHCLLNPVDEEREESQHPVQQVCRSLSRLSTAGSFKKEEPNSSSDPVKVVRIKEAWAPVPEDVVLRSKKQRNLNLINNNVSAPEEGICKRRSYQPTDFLSRVLVERPRRSSSAKRRHHPDGFPKSGSQNDLCDSWADEEECREAETSGTSGIGTNPSSVGGLLRQRSGSFRNGSSAEYPFQNNCFTPHQGINFDLTFKRELFVTLYSAVERLLISADSSEAETRCILLHEFCPALHSVMRDGLKREVITPFGRMGTTVWRVIEAVTRQGPSAATATCDLVMLLNTKYEASGHDDKKFAGFVMGLLNMSILHIWFSKLKWSLDILLRFYERHAFMCALHKETKLLFDELNFCLQRLYAIPFRFDLSHIQSLSSSAPEDSSSSKKDCDKSHYCCRRRSTTSHAETGRNSSAGSSTKSSKSRIPRPISLPKRLEAKLGNGGIVAGNTSSPTSPSKTPAKSPVARKGSRKSRVRETIRLFDSKSTTTNGKRHQYSTPIVATAHGIRNNQRTKKPGLKSPKTGAGESLAFESSGGGGGGMGRNKK